MKKKQFWIGMLSLLFVLLSTYLTFQFFSFPENVLKEVNITNHSTIERINKTFRFDFYLLTLDALLLLTLLYVLTSASMNLKKNEIIYVPKYYGKEDLDKHGNKDQPIDKKIENLQKEIDELDLPDDAEEQVQHILTHICHHNQVVSGALYQTKNYPTRHLKFTCGFAFSIPDTQNLEYEFGEGLIGQCGKSQRPIHLKNISTEYSQIISGLGSHIPTSLLILPISHHNGNTLGVLELAFFNEVSAENIEFIKMTSSFFTQKLEEISI